ncbi:MAG: PAS domain-containing sensor histidine kinase [Campylobacterota bacterium]|nr:PAS domain-containing sensor histidine kinase [Campylobacterota bacterium]
MLNKFWNIHYHDRLIFAMLKSSRYGTIISNFITPIIISYLMYDQFHPLILYIWVFLFYILGIARLKLDLLLRSDIRHKKETTAKHLHWHIYTTSITAFSLSMMASASVLYDVPEMNIQLIALGLIALSVGSLATLGTIFAEFCGYVFFAIAPLMITILYVGDENYYIFAFILFIFTITHIYSGYKLFLTYQNSIDLENQFKTLFDKSSHGLMIIKNHEIMECNDKLLNLLGYSRYEFFQTSPQAMMPKTQPDGRSSIRMMISYLRQSCSGTVTFQWQHIKKNGEKFWVEITLNPVYIDGYNIIQGTWNDITDKKKAARKIKELNESLASKVELEVSKNREKDKQMIQQSRLAQMGEMISMIAHQWRQPLSAISATSATLSIKANLNTLDNETTIDLSNKISEYSQHLSMTIDDFRNFFKVNKQAGLTNYDDLILSVLEIIETSIVNQNIKLITKLESKNSFDIYKSEVKQVILNLIKNSEDALIERKIENPQIKIETFGNTLRVSDNAGGIPEDILHKVFDPYFSTKTKKDGTGLGLYMSKMIIEDHCGGTLTVLNDVEGSLFTITLP